MLVLTNEREFHDIFKNHVQDFIENAMSYKQFRQKIYSFLCKHFEKYVNCTAVTSVVVWRGLLYYREEFRYKGSQAHTACARMDERWMQYTISHWTNNKQSYEGRKLNEDVQYWIRNKDRIQNNKMKSPKSEEEKTGLVKPTTSDFVIDDFSDIRPIPYQGDDKLDAIQYAMQYAMQFTEEQKQQLLNQAIPPGVFNQIKESTMPVNAKTAVSQVTYIFGVDAANVSDTAIFEHIRNIENEIKSLEAIKAAPVALMKRIDEMYKDIEALVKFSNDRQPA